MGVDILLWYTKQAIPIYNPYVGNVGNLFPTNFLKNYIKNGVIMRISDIFYIFVAMWLYGSIKKYFKKTLYNIKTFL